MKTITRRDFLRVGAASVAAAGVSKNAWAKPKSDEFIEARWGSAQLDLLTDARDPNSHLDKSPTGNSKRNGENSRPSRLRTAGRRGSVP